MNILASEQRVSCRSILSLSGFPDLEPRFVVFRKTLNNKTLQQPETSFPALGFSGTIVQKITVSLCLCACTFSRSELVKVYYVFALMLI